MSDWLGQGDWKTWMFASKRWPAWRAPLGLSPQWRSFVSPVGNGALKLRPWAEILQSLFAWRLGYANLPVFDVTRIAISMSTPFSVFSKKPTRVEWLRLCSSLSSLSSSGLPSRVCPTRGIAGTTKTPCWRHGTAVRSIAIKCIASMKN